MDALLDISELSDEQLAAEAAREGSDGPAFLTLVERFRPQVWRVCYRLLSNVDDANDAAQEVFVRLFLNRNKFKGHSKYSTWVHGLAVRTCLQVRRGRGRRQRRETHVAVQATRKQDEKRREASAENVMDLMQMLDTLDDEDRAMLIMKYSEGQSYDELAKTFEMSVSACKMRVSRARGLLRQRFPEHGFGSDDESK